MSHRVVIIDGITPPPGGTAATAAEDSTPKVRIEWRPEDSLTPAQVGARVERMVRLITKIETGSE